MIHMAMNSVFMLTPAIICAKLMVGRSFFITHCTSVRYIIISLPALNMHLLFVMRLVQYYVSDVIKAIGCMCK